MTATVERLDWRDHAACRRTDPDLFFGPEGEKPAAQEMREQAARMICARCPVTGACAEWADRTGDHWSVSGGLTPDQRTRARMAAGLIANGERRRAALEAAGEKLCTGPCGETKPLSEFYRDGKAGKGWRGNCKICRNEKLRQQREERVAS